MSRCHLTIQITVTSIHGFCVTAYVFYYILFLIVLHCRVWLLLLFHHLLRFGRLFWLPTTILLHLDPVSGHRRSCGKNLHVHQHWNVLLRCCLTDHSIDERNVRPVVAAKGARLLTFLQYRAFSVLPQPRLVVVPYSCDEDCSKGCW